MSVLDPDLTLTRCQAMNQQHLLAYSYFSDMPVWLDSKDLSDEQIKNEMQIVKTTGGKLGAGIVVLKPMFTKFGSTSPACEIEQAFIAYVHPKLNLSNVGTQKTVDAIAIMVARRMVRSATVWPKNFWFAHPSAPIVEYNDMDDLEGRMIRVRCEVAISMLAKVAPVSGSIVNGKLALACATAGASIYYTTDGSYPRVGNTAATLYSTSITVASGSVVYAAAFATNLAGSDVAVIEIS